jgi:hypothetical protein
MANTINPISKQRARHANKDDADDAVTTLIIVDGIFFFPMY